MVSSSKIYRRLFTPYVLTLLLGLGGAWLAATQLFSETLEKRLQTQLIHTVDMLTNGAFPYTPKLLERLSRLIHADIVLLNANGLITISTVENDSQQLQARFSEILTATTNQNTSIQELESAGHHYLLVWDRVSQSRDPRVAYIAAFSNLSDIHDTSQRMAKWLGAAALSGLLLLAWIGHRVSRSITLPIKELAHMASEIAVGNRNIRAKIHRSDEIGELAGALNAMAVKLADYDHEIAEQSRMATLGQMTARIAHEIRNPLTAIKMQLQLLKETADKQNKPVLDSLLDETRRLELIVLSTLQHKKIAKPVFTRMNINSLIEEIAQLHRLQFEHQNLLLALSLDPAIPEVEIDRDMMTQILLNLLLNARDEMPDGGKIHLSSGSLDKNAGIWFAVDDSGSGIPEENWQTLFTETTSLKPGGFGLGLRLCHELAELHNGQINIRHSKLGGARFTVTLPLAGPNQ
jgi:signal transduction histidine kinase